MTDRTDRGTPLASPQAADRDSPVLVDVRGHVMLVTLNRPDARNAVNRALAIGVGEALERAEADHEIRAVIVTGSGDKAFCAGADLKEVAQTPRTTQDDPRLARWGFAGYVRHQVSKPTIAAVNGAALGGGTEIVLASDLAVASDTAVFGLPEVKRGLFAGAGGVFRLPRQIPPKMAMEIILTGEPITAEEAHHLALVNRVVPPADLLDTAFALADRICANAPLAVQASKRIARSVESGTVAGEEVDWDRTEAEWGALLASADTREGVRAFVEKRAPRWTGR